MNMPSVTIHLPLPLLKPNHIHLTACDEVTSIAEPLMKTFGVNSFSFVKCYWTGEIASLTTHRAWAEYSNKNAWYRFLEGIPDFRLRKYIFMDEVKNNTPYWKHNINLAAEIFDLCHGVVLIERHIGYLIFYYYTTTHSHTNFNHTFLLYMDKFKAFNYYFKNTAKKLITTAETQRYKIPHFAIDKLPFAEPASIQDELLAKFENDIVPKRHYTDGYNYLTTREFECSKLLISGKKTKEIASELKISTYTANEYINNLKLKFSVETREELVEQLLKLSATIPSFSLYDKEEIIQLEKEYSLFLKEINRKKEK